MTNESIEKRLYQMKEKGLYRELRYLQTAQNPKVTIDNKEVLLFGSNNYLGLCNDPRLKEAAINAVMTYGTGSGGSRLTTGSYDLNQKLEQDLAAFKKTEAALVFNTGYMANVGIISALCNKDWVIFSDRLNHASILDGCRLSGAKLIRYNHCDMNDLEKRLISSAGQNNLIVTDGVFSMDGDVAPLERIVSLARKYNCMTMVDDAHGMGVLGKDGSGSASYCGVAKDISILMGTLSKAVGCEGGYVAGSQKLIDFLINSSRSFIYSTALAPASVAASIKAIEIIKTEPHLRSRLSSMSQWVRMELANGGFETGHWETPIIPIMIGDAKKTVAIHKNLLDHGIYIPAIRPPSVAEGTSRLRLSIMATHTQKDLVKAVDKIYRANKELI